MLARVTALRHKRSDPANRQGALAPLRSVTNARLLSRVPPSTRRLLAWALYDWASSPYFAVVLTFVFATYFTQAVAANEIDGTAQWGLAMSISALLIAVSSPILGAIADAGGSRRLWLAICTAVAAIAIALLWLIRPEPDFVLPALVLVVVANTVMELGQALYNAMLADLASRDRIGRWSGMGWGLGYVAGIAALGLVLAVFIQPDPPPFGLDEASAENVRITGPLIALWLVLFALPLFLATRDTPGQAMNPVAGVGAGLHLLAATLRSLGRGGQVTRFLAARLVYNDGLTTLFAFGGIYAAGTFGMATNEIILFAIALNLTAGIGAFAFGFIDDRLGSKRTILLALAGLVLFGTITLLAQDKATFWAFGVLVGIFVGPAQSASRTLMARLSPEGRRNEMFGLYALSGKLTAFLGPLLFGLATAFFETQRAGMAVVVLLLLAGGLLLAFTVREPKRG